ncbi:SGNH/GDSL hydrolase family protein [Longispora sp. K20-0274]|uniref:SGNH/GDSL hydrolase family protein n=1 Tax=Longispora sp. K20-0274 TaxID=3088255 RepID=UPI00399A3EBB
MRIRLALLPFAALLLTPGAAGAAPPPTAPPPALDAVVALGDSIASGEGAGDYHDGANATCHRSDHSQLAAAQIPGTNVVNLACSGAETADVLVRGQGGEPPQVQALRAAAGQYRIKLVLITVGANDVGFTEIVTDCAVGYALSTASCKDEWTPKVAERLTALRPRLDSVLAQVRGALADAGQPDARIVLQSYPSPLTVHNRWDSRFSRVIHGCPFHDDDAAWGRGTFVPLLAATMRAAAQDAAVDFLDLTSAMDDKEVCSPGDDPKWTRGISLKLPEDGRGVVRGTEPDGVISRESLHPNQLGHAMLGQCLSGYWGQLTSGVCHRQQDGLHFVPVPISGAP